MTFLYDKDADALEIRFVADGIVARTVEVDSGTLVDVNEAGVVLSIEVIQPARQVPIDEIVARFAIADREAAVLRSLWGENTRLPFAPSRELAVA